MTDLTPTQKSLLDELFKDFRGNAKELLGEHGLLKRITQRAPLLCRRLPNTAQTFCVTHSTGRRFAGK